MIDLETRIENELWSEIQTQISQAVIYEIGAHSWLEEHCPGRWYNGNYGKIMFEDERDRVMFVLRWGHDNIMTLSYDKI